MATIKRLAPSSRIRSRLPQTCAITALHLYSFPLLETLMNRSVHDCVEFAPDFRVIYGIRWRCRMHALAPDGEARM